jgi:hypothetical protein
VVDRQGRKLVVPLGSPLELARVADAAKVRLPSHEPDVDILNMKAVREEVLKRRGGKDPANPGVEGLFGLDDLRDFGEEHFLPGVFYINAFKHGHESPSLAVAKARLATDFYKAALKAPVTALVLGSGPVFTDDVLAVLLNSIFSGQPSARDVEESFDAATQVFPEDQRARARRAFDLMFFEEFLEASSPTHDFAGFGPEAAARAVQSVGMDPSSGPKLWNAYRSVAAGIRALVVDTAKPVDAEGLVDSVRVRLPSDGGLGERTADAERAADGLVLEDP